MDEKLSTTLALDLEGTLISNHVSQIARPGLFAFLNEVKGIFGSLVIFTSVPEARFRQIAQQLVSDALVPSWFADMAYVHWTGQYKDLSVIPGDAILLDDYEGYIKPDQADRWVHIECFASPYSEDDRALEAALERLKAI